MAKLKTLHVLVDSREKKPLPLPAYLDVLSQDRCWPQGPLTTTIRVLQTRRQIDIADYVLADEDGVMYLPDGSNCAIVERKATLDELGENLFDPERRPHFENLLRRMQERCTNPVLYLEGGFKTTGKMPSEAPRGAILDALARLLQKYHISHCFWTGSSMDDRREAGEWVVRWLYNSAYTSPPSE